MTTEAETTKPTKPQTKSPGPDEIPISKVLFHGSRDLPSEQQVSRITSGPRTDRPCYEIALIRNGKFRVKEFSPIDGKYVHTFLVPGDWGVAIVDPAFEPGSAKLGA